MPLWQGSATALGQTYSYVMVGSDPSAAGGSSNVTIPVDLVPVKVELLSASGQPAHTFDPSAPNPDCGLSASPAQLVLQSPLFQPRPYVVGGVNVGTVQYESAFMREEFAKQVLGPGAPDPSYGVTFSPVTHPEITVTVPSAGWKLLPASARGFCGGRPGGDFALINEATWDGFLQQTLISKLQSVGDADPAHMLVFLLGNVAMPFGSPPQCCAAGYHSGVQTAGGVQYYATALYGAPGVVGHALDVAALSHELGEWLNDPNGNNLTPSWGHTGQVSSCQPNLEVGDPLSKTTVAVPMPNGITYHPQELAFASWFFRQHASPGINGWYSSNGTFRTAPPVCTG